MSWTDWIPAIIEGAGLIAGRDDGKRPDQPDPIDLEKLARLIQTNTSSPWGGMTYTQGDDGQYTAQYNLTPETQAIFDRSVSRSLNPDQAYQQRPDAVSLLDALTAQRLQRYGGAPSGPRPRPSARSVTDYEPGVDRPPFVQAEVDRGVATPAQNGRTGSEGYGSTGGGYSGGSGGAGAYGVTSPSGRPQQGFNDFLNENYGPMQGINPSPAQQFAIENAGLIGDAVSLASGIPGLGYVGDYVTNQHFQNNAWQSPAPENPDSLNNSINRAVAANPGSAESLRELAGGRQSGGPTSYNYAYRVGPWTKFNPSSGSGNGAWLYARSYY